MDKKKLNALFWLVITVLFAFFWLQKVSSSVSPDVLQSTINISLCQSQADTNCDGCIGNEEFSGFRDLWLNVSYSNDNFARFRDYWLGVGPQC